MTVIIDLERLFSELGYKTQRKRWGIFRNALQDKAKEKLKYELERVGMTPERIIKLSEDETKSLDEWAMGVLEKLLCIDPEKKNEAKLKAQSIVFHSRADDRQYESDSTRTHQLQQTAQVAGQSSAKAKALPAYEQRKSLQDLHESVRRWADVERAGRIWKKKEYVSELKGKGRGKKGKNKDKGKGKGKDKMSEMHEGNSNAQPKAEAKAAAKAEAKAKAQAKTDFINTLATSFSQALSQTYNKGKGASQNKGDSKGKGAGKSDQKDYSKIKCWICGGLHLAKLWGKGHCPNEVTETNGTAAQHKQNGVRCT